MNNFRVNLKMPRRLFDFKCKNSHSTEAFVDVDTKEIQCSECDEIATRIISPTGIYLEPFSGNHPGAYDRWTRVRAEKLKLEKKTNAEHGS
jgi:hypothetical protein